MISTTYNTGDSIQFSLHNAFFSFYLIKQIMEFLIQYTDKIYIISSQSLEEKPRGPWNQESLNAP